MKTILKIGALALGITHLTFAMEPNKPQNDVSSQEYLENLGAMDISDDELQTQQNSEYESIFDPAFQNLLSCIDQEAESRNPELIASKTLLNERMLAAIRDDKPIEVQKLLQAGANPNARDREGSTGLMLTNSELICGLLLRYGADINAKLSGNSFLAGSTALLVAANEGQEKKCRFLLAFGADVNAAPESGWTPLLVAAQKGNESLCRLFLEKGADVHARIAPAWPVFSAATALHFAVEARNVVLTKLFLEKGLDPNSSCGYSTPLMLAEDAAICSLLLDFGANPNFHYRDGRGTALSTYAFKCYYDLCALVLDRGADVTLAGNENGIFSDVIMRFEYTDESVIIRPPEAIVVRVLITHPIFNPIRTEAQLNNSRQRVWNTLCALKCACPSLPRDIRYKILSIIPELQEDVRNCAFGFHKGHNERAPFLPMQVVAKLIQGKLLNPEESVKAIKANHFERIRPLMLKTYVSLRKGHTLKPLLNPDDLELNYARGIEGNIRRRLGLPQEICAVELMQESNKNDQQKDDVDEQDVRLKDRKRDRDDE